MRPFAASDDGWTPRARPRRRRAAISLTPLIDVVFILLIFFMFASSFLDWRTIRLDAAAPGGGPALEGALLVEVTPAGLRVGGRPIAAEALRLRVAALLEERADLRVVVRPATGATLQATVDALELLAGAGARGVSLAAAGG